MDNAIRELNPGERRFWFLAKLDGDTGGYQVARTFMLEGEIDADALAAALRVVVARHPVLRTRIEELDGVPYATLVAPDALELVRSEPDGDVVDRLATEADRPFDLGRGPLFRAVLLKLGERRAAFQYVVHHMLFDGVSRVIFERELSAAYRALRTNAQPQLPPLASTSPPPWGPVDTVGQLAYWTQRLQDPPALAWPTNRRPRPSGAQAAGQLEMVLDPVTLDGLRSLARAEHTSLFAVGLSLYAHLIGTMGRTRDVVIGYSLDRRLDPEAEDAIGLCMNTTACRIELGGIRNSRQLVRRTRDVVLDAFDHGDVSFDAVVDALDLPRSVDASPLFSNWFALEDGVLASQLELDGLRCVLFQPPVRRLRFDTELTVTTGPNATAQLGYAAERFEAVEMERFLARYLSLLQQAAQDPDAPLTASGRLDRRERNELLALGSSSPGGARPQLAATILRHADQHPDTLAVEAETQLSYADLVTAASELALQIREAGVGPGDVVAVNLPRSSAFVVGVVGVLLASAAYLPIPDDVPERRRAELLEDSGARAVVVPANDTPKDLPCSVVNLPARTNGQVRSAPSTAEGDRLLYVVYTSGSTGRPKGVAVSHDQLAGLVAWHNSTYRLARGERVAQLASAAFDAFGWEVWSTLAAGATLVVCPEETVADTSSLLAWLADRSISVAFAPTPVAEGLIRHDLAERTRLRVLLTGGDRFRPGPDDAPGVPIVDHYGPTENAVVATATGELSPPWDDLAIGRPIDGVTAYLVDEALQLAPRGAIGELCLGGTRVAWGYRNRSRLTAAAFVPDPFAGVAGARMYRTGDLASWRPDGQLAFLGRADEQLEVGGRRIEPAEVESALLAHTAVSDVVVTARPDRTGRDTLVAYVVADPATSTGELRKWLSDRLPRYLVPSLFVRLDRLPIGPTGKVARSQLPEPEWTRRELVTPRSPVEMRIAEHWRSILGIEGEISVDDDFFELGGNSMVAARLMARLSDEFGIRLALRTLFDSGSIAGVAQAVEEALREEISAMSPDQVAHALAQIHARGGG